MGKIRGNSKERGNTMKYNGLVWSDTLLDNGNRHTQSEWVALLKETEWRLPTVKEYESLLGCKGEFMDDLRKEMTRHWLMAGDVIINPFTGAKRPVVLGLYDYNRFLIIAFNVNYYWPARGVAVAPKKKGVLK
jgi:hypothetical protein